MAMKKTPVTGMRDILPKESEIRSYVIDQIRQTYGQFGFSSIETPCVEHIGNLLSKQGGENEKLIFKILKRGAKLRLEEAGGEADLVDSGLRYDLTLPLSRYYANHANELPSPFKALQMGNVWRADRPQRGRFRQFMQCDIDVLGEPSVSAEIDLCLATTTLLGKLGFKGFKIRINDRRILKAMAASCGFKSEDYDSVFITLDKMDKIGLAGVAEELEKNGYPRESVDGYLSLFESVGHRAEDVLALGERLMDTLKPSIAEDLAKIMRIVEDCKCADFEMFFDPTLVRGMSYYTGPIFEISMDEFGGSVGGGGRYDEMIGKFTGNPTPAVGFSIGFERIVMLLLERDYQAAGAGEKIAFLIDKKLSDARLTEISREAMRLRAQGQSVSVCVMKKNKKFQKDQLTAEGFSEIREFYND